MIKRILTYFLVFFSVFLVSFYLHQNYIENQDEILPFSLKKVYLFHLGFSLLICTNFLLFSSVDKIFEQLGFVYLATLIIKIIVFCIIFYQSIFKQENLSQMARLGLFIPSIIFLLTEAVFVVKILNKKQ